MLSDMWSFVRSSLPIVVVQFCTLLFLTLTVMRVGSLLGTTALAGISLGVLTFNLTGLTLIMAPMCALDTKAPQAFGAGRHAEVGFSCQRALVCAIAICIPASLVWWHAEVVLVGLGQTSDVARLAARFLRWLLPALPVQTGFEITRRFLYAQNVTWPPLVATLCGVLGHIGWHSACVEWFGIEGAALSLVFTYGTSLLVLVVIVACRRPYHPSTMPRLFDRRLWQDRREWLSFIVLSGASLVNLSEWVFWEVVSFMIGHLGAQALAVQGMGYSLVPLVTMIPHGLSIGLSNGVGNLLGAGEVAKARRLAQVACLFCLLVVLGYSAAVLLLATTITSLFTHQAAISTAAMPVWPLVSCDMVFDGMFMMLSGLCRGLGVQKRSAACVIVCLWCFGFPLQLFATRSVVELWRNMIPTYALLDASLLACAFCTSWTRLSADMQQSTSLACSEITCSSSYADHDGRQGDPSSKAASPSRSSRCRGPATRVGPACNEPVDTENVSNIDQPKEFQATFDVQAP